MPAYARKTTIEDQYGARRGPDGAILCGFCNKDLADQSDNPQGAIYLVYTDKKHLDENRPYEVYCSDCLAAHFPKAKMVK
jgi:hypothetical protein